MSELCLLAAIVAASQTQPHQQTQPPTSVSPEPSAAQSDCQFRHVEGKSLGQKTTGVAQHTGVERQDPEFSPSSQSDWTVATASDRLGDRSSSHLTISAGTAFVRSPDMGSSDIRSSEGLAPPSSQGVATQTAALLRSSQQTLANASRPSTQSDPMFAPATASASVEDPSVNLFFPASTALDSSTPDLPPPVSLAPTLGNPSLDPTVFSQPRIQSVDWSSSSSYSSEFSDSARESTTASLPSPLRSDSIRSDSTGANTTGSNSPELDATGLDVTGLDATGSNADRLPIQLASLGRVAVPQTKAVRPASGRQFFRQRWVALQAGRSYTRLATDSFAHQWMNATYNPSHEDWIQLLAQEANAMARGQGNNRLTIMLGDSISLWFPTDYMARYRFWLNQSISGDTAAGTLQRLALFSRTNPDTIHVMLGINDLRRGVSDAHLLYYQRQIMRRLRQQHPQAQVIVHSILPTRWASLPSDRISRINSQLEAIAQQEGAQFLNLYPYFVDDQGILRTDLTTDGLHLNPQGYALWYRILSHMRLV